MAQTPNPTSRQWHQRASASIPGGVNSPVRAFGSVGGDPLYIVRGQGAEVFDADGNSYIDLVGAWGPMIAGHAHPAVVEAATQALTAGSHFGAPHPNEVLLAEEVLARVPAAERIRFVTSGTEAVMTAIRLARAFTGRNLIAKFAGCYHGHGDALLAAAGSGVATLGLPDSPGVTAATARETVVIDYNDPAALEELFATRGHELAAIITEAVPANMGVVPPLPGFNAQIAALAKTHGALLILDEVMTGFRISRSGYFGTVAEEGWRPDIFTFGKVIGGGLPLAAVAGRAEVLDQLAPRGPVYQAGTLSGNPVATAAGLATLQLCDPELYRRLDDTAAQIAARVSAALASEGVPHQLQNYGNLFSIFFTPQPVHNYAQAGTQNRAQFAAFFHAMREGGISIPPSAFEAWFVSGAHTAEHIERVAQVAKRAARAAAQVVP